MLLPSDPLVFCPFSDLLLTHLWALFLMLEVAYSCGISPGLHIPCLQVNTANVRIIVSLSFKMSLPAGSVISVSLELVPMALSPRVEISVEELC